MANKNGKRPAHVLILESLEMIIPSVGVVGMIDALAALALFGAIGASLDVLAAMDIPLEERAEVLDKLNYCAYLWDEEELLSEIVGSNMARDVYDKLAQE